MLVLYRFYGHVRQPFIDELRSYLDMSERSDTPKVVPGVTNINLRDATASYDYAECIASTGFEFLLNVPIH